MFTPAVCTLRLIFDTKLKYSSSHHRSLMNKLIFHLNYWLTYGNLELLIEKEKLDFYFMYNRKIMKNSKIKAAMVTRTYVK